CRSPYCRRHSQGRRPARARRECPRRACLPCGAPFACWDGAAAFRRATKGGVCDSGRRGYIDDMSSNPPAIAGSPEPVSPINSERFGRLLGSVFRKWRRYVDDEFRDLGFTDATRSPLIGLYDHAGSMRQRDLADHLGLEASALVRVISLLEKRGL